MTIHNLLADKPRKRPSLKVSYVQAIIRACRADEAEIQRWRARPSVHHCLTPRSRTNVIAHLDRTVDNGGVNLPRWCWWC
jgi:hypothetical protein